MGMDGKKKDLKSTCWKAFLESGEPGYYMLYQALSKDEDGGEKD